MAFNSVPVRYEPEFVTEYAQNLSEHDRRKFFSSMEYFLATVIFPLIDPEPFAVLYSDSKAPCYPVNILIAAEIYKQFRMISDQSLIEIIDMSPNLKFALHMLDYFDGERIFSTETLTRFRARCQNYYDQNRIDLMQNMGHKMAEDLTHMLETDTALRRIDSGFVDSHIAGLSRMKLLYLFIQLAVKSIVKTGRSLDRDMQHYLDPEDWNLISYYDELTPSKLKTSLIIEEGRKLIDQFQNDPVVSQLDDFLYLKRALNEQVIQDEDGSFRLKKNKAEGLSSQTLQSPFDTDATFRNKAGEAHKGYIGLIVESGRGSNRVRTWWEYAVNTTSDPVLLEHYLRNLEDPEPGSQQVVLVGDGLFSGTAQKDLALKKNIRIITTDLVGKKPDMFLCGFKRDESGTQILECPNHEVPIKCGFNEKNGTIRAHFPKESCEHCPLKEQCRSCEKARTNVVAVTKSQMDRAEDWNSQKQDKDYAYYAAYRAGVEANFSLLRRKYRIDQQPVREFLPTRYRFNTVMIAINVKQAFDHFTSLERKKTEE